MSQSRSTSYSLPRKTQVVHLHPHPALPSVPRAFGSAHARVPCASLPSCSPAPCRDRCAGGRASLPLACAPSLGGWHRLKPQPTPRHPLPARGCRCASRSARTSVATSARTNHDIHLRARKSVQTHFSRPQNHRFFFPFPRNHLRPTHTPSQPPLCARNTPSARKYGGPTSCTCASLTTTATSSNSSKRQRATCKQSPTRATCATTKSSGGPANPTSPRPSPKLSPNRRNNPRPNLPPNPRRNQSPTPRPLPNLPPNRQRRPSHTPIPAHRLPYSSSHPLLYSKLSRRSPTFSTNPTISHCNTILLPP